MPERSLLIKVMIAALIAAGGLLSLSVFIGGQEEMVQLMLSAVTIAGAAVAMVVIHVIFIRPEAALSPTVVALLAIILTEVILAMLGIWGYRMIDGDLVAGSAAVIGLIGSPVAVSYLLVPRPQTKWAGTIGVVGGSLAVAILLVACIEKRVPIFITGWAALWTVAMAMGTVLWREDTLGAGMWWRWPGLIAGVAAGACLTWMGWEFQRTNPSEEFLFWLTVFGCTGGWTAVAGVLLLCTLPRWGWWLLRTTLVVAAIFAAAFMFMTWMNISQSISTDAVIFRLLIASGIGGLLLALATVLTSVSRVLWIAPGPEYGALVRCPSCRARQRLAPGENACVHCSMEMTMWWSAPTCPACGYETAGASAEFCPECGLLIRQRTDPTDS